MTTTVSSGGVATQGSRTYLFGSSSGLDTSALVQVAYNARVAEADKIDVTVTANTKKKDAYSTLQTLGQAVQTSLANLRQAYGYSTTDNSLFSKRAGTMSTNDTTDPTKLLGVTIDNGTTLGTHQIEVIQKAKANRVGSDPAASATTALGYTGTFDLGLAGGTASTINVTSGMSLTDIASAINTSGTSSGVTASVLKVSDTSYQLVLSANTTAKAITFTNVTGNDVLANIGVASGGTATHVLQSADQAILKLDNVTVTRNSNQIDDLISGVHLTVQNAEAGTLIDLDVANDTSGLKDGITAFVASYNALRDNVIANQATTSTGVASDDATLFGDYLMKSMSDSVQAMLGGSYGAGGTDISTLRDLGITMDGNNKLVVDETKLDTALLSNFDQVKNIFTTKITTDNSNFAVLANTSKTKSLSGTIDITTSGGSVTSASVGGDSSLFTVSGNSIVGKAGTAWEGLSFAYVGSSNASVAFSMNQGLADLTDNTLDTFTDIVTGSLQTEKLNLDAQNTSISARAAQIRDRADEYRNQLIDRYAGYEQQIAQSKSVLAQLKAILGTSDS